MTQKLWALIEALEEFFGLNACDCHDHCEGKDYCKVNYCLKLKEKLDEATK